MIKMDVVYIYKDTTSSDEFRYSLRSIEKHLKGYNTIWLVGRAPKWVSGLVKVISVNDRYYNKQMNAINKILSACRNNNVSSDFILMNDDFFFLEDVHVDEIKTYTWGEITDEFISTKRGQYASALKRCVKLMGDDNRKNFEVHYPIVINKQKFRSLLTQIPWSTNVTTYRSIYGNKHCKDTVDLKEDFKVYNYASFCNRPHKEFISTSETIFKNTLVQEWFLKTFREKSKFECD